MGEHRPADPIPMLYVIILRGATGGYNSIPLPLTQAAHLLAEVREMGATADIVRIQGAGMNLGRRPDCT